MENKVKKILLVSVFGDIIDKSNSRLSKVYSALSGNVLQFITSDFDHHSRMYKKIETLPSGIYIHVPSYKGSLSINRIISHVVFAINLWMELKRMKFKPDVLYCIMPTSTSAYVCGKFCRKNDIKFIIDVIDLWPESLYPINRFYRILRFFFYPWEKITEKTYAYADVICAESKEYMQVAKCFNPVALSNYTYLGIDKMRINRLLFQSSIELDKPQDELWISYGGHLGNSYDFQAIINALIYIQNKKIRYKFFFIGDGEKKKQILSLSSKYKLNVIVTGILPYCDYLKYLSFCDIGINAFKEKTKVVHSYKFNDYVAMNLLVLNNLQGETAVMVSTYKIGLNFNFSDYTLSEALYEVCSNWNIYSNWKENNKQLFSELLDQDIIYKRMINLFFK
jgi:glycosyltransferase involved in cell wall biosynthesis